MEQDAEDIGAKFDRTRRVYEIASTIWVKVETTALGWALLPSSDRGDLLTQMQGHRLSRVRGSV